MIEEQLVSDTAKLRELLAAATPGPWEVRDDHGDSLVVADDAPLWDARCDDETGFALGEQIVISHADAALILAAVNALPELLDRLEAAEADVRMWRSYAQHTLGCESWDSDLENEDGPISCPCTCGLDALRAALAELDAP